MATRLDMASRVACCPAMRIARSSGCLRAWRIWSWASSTPISASVSLLRAARIIKTQQLPSLRDLLVLRHQHLLDPTRLQRIERGDSVLQCHRPEADHTFLGLGGRR